MEPQQVEQLASNATPKRVNLKAMGLQTLEQFVVEQGQPRFRGQQLFNWLYGHGVTDFDAMTNLPKSFRSNLSQIASLNTVTIDQLQTSADRTIKGLFRLSSGRQIETVLIPDFEPDGSPRRLTVCVSSQVGCAMGCTFCATGLMGFQQNLTAGEIFDQVWLMNTLSLKHFGKPVSNVVFMGMGEPLLNYDAVMQSISLMGYEEGLHLAPKRITVSTVGLARRIRQLADDGATFNLAISLHAPTQEQRSSIMPVNRAAATDLDALKDAVQHYTRVTQKRVTYEYCMFEGFNDTEDDARNLSRIAGWGPCKVNLIMYNPVEGLGFRRTREEQLNRFIRVLVSRKVRVTVRRSRGQDIDAACGQLALKKG